LNERKQQLCPHPRLFSKLPDIHHLLMKEFKVSSPEGGHQREETFAPRRKIFYLI
jgi:hypothetical protein